jgi:hypothetical protein
LEKLIDSRSFFLCQHKLLTARRGLQTCRCCC